MVVIGGGNTAIDSARTALRLGAKKVTVMYRRTIGLMPAYESEVHEALEEGIEIIELAAPINLIMGTDGRVAQIECLKMELGGFDAEGRRQFISAPNSRFKIEADTVIPAVSQYADFPFIGKDEIGITRWGTFILQDSDSQMTTMQGVFAGGDVTRGPDEVIRAIADGKRAAVSIDKYLGGKGKLNKGEPIDIPVITDEDEVIAHKRFPGRYAGSRNAQGLVRRGQPGVSQAERHRRSHALLTLRKEVTQTMVNLTINGNQSLGAGGLPQSWKPPNPSVSIFPTCAILSGVHQFGSCRICVVEVEGMPRTLQASCLAKVT